MNQKMNFELKTEGTIFALFGVNILLILVEGTISGYIDTQELLKKVLWDAYDDSIVRQALYQKYRRDLFSTGEALREHIRSYGLVPLDESAQEVMFVVGLPKYGIQGGQFFYLSVGLPIGEPIHSFDQGVRKLGNLVKNEEISLLEAAHRLQKIASSELPIEDPDKHIPQLNIAPERIVELAQEGNTLLFIGGSLLKVVSKSDLN